MWITSDVDVPLAVLEAHSEQRLVFFVGAGVSVDAPSSLPLFGKLAQQLAERARTPFVDNVPLDHFLGSLPEGFETHRHASELISRDGATPNTTHTALVRVASSFGQLRIVTTNFDVHLSSAANAEGIAVPDTWIGPALPLGSDFTGIVHLHGSVRRNSRELVLTDSDFGRAYLTNAWATRFLLPMFEKFTVLFIGYSHDDPLMRYLALGLPSGTPRYAFIDAADVNYAKWTRLGVETIGYPVQGHDHSALVAALEAWDLRARMGQTEHRGRMVEIVNGGPTLTPVDHDYLIGRLRSADGASEFAQEASAVEPSLQVGWLNWVESLPEFRSIFAGKDGGVAAAILGSWFCRSFIAIPELHGAALKTLQRLGQTLDDSIFQTAGWAAEELGKVNAGAGRRWKVLLATSIHGQSAPFSPETLLAYLPGDAPEEPAVLRAALRPYLVLKRHLFASDSEDLATLPDAEVRWKADADSLTEHILKVVDTAMPGDLALGTMLEDSLLTAYELLEAYHGSRAWDPLSFGRTAIKPHEQDEFRNPIDAIIDGLRAYGEKGVYAQPHLPERWWLHQGTLFRRLALHLLAFDASRTANEKISWLIDRSVLYEADLKHEVYQVLEVAVGETSQGIREHLLAAAQSGPTYSHDISDHERHIAYTIYNLLVWLVRIAPDWAEAGTALATAQTANPDFQPRPHPDVDRWMTSGTWGGKLPVEPQDFIESFDADSFAATDTLLSPDYSNRNFDEPDWDDVLSLVNRVAESRPDVGEGLCILLDERPEFKARANDILHAVIEGWAKASLGELSETVVARVATQVFQPDSARTVSRFLLEQVRKQIESDEAPVLSDMRRIAYSLWQEHGQTFTHSEGADLSSFAPLYLNSWPGDLAQYWISEVDRRWRKHQDDWSGLNDDERLALSQLLNGPPHALDATGPAVANQLYFLFAADEAFATEQILPLFREHKTASLAWSAYLHNPRCNDKLLAAGLLDSTIAQWGRLDTMGNRGLRHQFLDLVVSIVSFAGIGPDERQVMLDQSILTNDGAYAAEFAHRVALFLSAKGRDGTEVWERWLRSHLTERLNGVPRTPDEEELSRWADSVPYLGHAVPEAVKLLEGRQIGLDVRFFKLDFPEQALSDHGPILVTHFAERIHNTQSGNRLVGFKITKLIDMLRQVLGESGVQPLVNEASEKGFLCGSMGY